MAVAPPILTWLVEALVPFDKPLAGYRGPAHLLALSDTEITCYTREHVGGPLYIGFEPAVLKTALDKERADFQSKGSLLYHVFRTVCDWIGVAPDMTVTAGEARIGGMVVAVRKGEDFVESPPTGPCAKVEPLEDVMDTPPLTWYYAASSAHAAAMTMAHTLALREYTLDSSKFNVYFLLQSILGPDEANAVMGANAASASAAIYGTVTDAIRTMRPLNAGHAPFTVFRATNYFPVDGEHSMLSKPKPFMLVNATACSTSATLAIAKKFQKKRYCCLFQLSVPAAYTSYACLFNVSTYEQEHEVLLPPGVGFLVQDIVYYRMGQSILTLIRATVVEADEALAYPNAMTAVDSASFDDAPTAVNVITQVYSSVRSMDPETGAPKFDNKRLSGLTVTLGDLGAASGSGGTTATVTTLALVAVALVVLVAAGWALARR